ncbi:hypothetical protein P152DRAFT_388822 [Eremomyces bilateralis CBS 781.70]|uniref:YDG domain-containing protein n=1 Tax=Eremomyces bilateralis CBS 781.70 TaxID=1392243 RepID=A0A6G1GEI3_9PEZI|nr:uncharacterized protein P152DRAFT_388822 [Eremomyces bilateralis CBS 781.70]KAF1816468.1 hypothetical protein P152DRAFT_388822 [Eremomyces bilateralis CBS 781.70]
MDTDEVLSRNGSLQDYALISERLQQITNAKAKPDPVGEPPVWAQRRQAMCETLLYARNYQSCAYTLNGISHSCTFDLASGPRAREFMDADVIIATAGGGLTKEKFDDAMTREHDQPVTGVIQALRNNTQFENAVVIICGERNVNSPSKMPHPYNVLGWFKPTHVWSEKIGGKRVFRFRFERIVVEDVSWWAPQGVTNPAPLGSLPTPIVRTCSECQRSSPQIYLQGWMCLNDGNEICQNFWLLNGQEPNDNLNFDPRFLKQKTHWETDGEPHSLAPSPMPVELGRIQGQGVSWEAWRGIVCPHCGSCNSREHWLAWVCSNPNCGAKYTIPATPLPLAALQDLQHPISDGFAFNRDLLNHSFDGMQHRVQNIEGCRTNVFTIPGAKGCIVHILANKSMNAVPGGADYMWDRLQNVDIGLRRRLMKSAIIRGGFLTNHFAANFGVQYNYVAMVDSKPIEDADPVISTARSLMDRISKRVTSEFAPGMHVEFNEVLALGYFEKQMIKYHDDGETGLGPVIATLSIGQPAIMTLRMKAKYYNGSSKNGCYVDAAPLPGCRDHAIRKEAHEQLNTIPDPAQRRARMAELPKELKLKKTGVAPDAVSMHLAHGDIVIMAGEEIQKYFEHQVKPTGNLRFALTCRYIDPASVGLASVHDHAHDHDDGGVESVENDG